MLHSHRQAVLSKWKNLIQTGTKTIKVKYQTRRLQPKWGHISFCVCWDEDVEILEDLTLAGCHRCSGVLFFSSPPTALQRQPGRWKWVYTDIQKTGFLVRKLKVSPCGDELELPAAISLLKIPLHCPNQTNAVLVIISIEILSINKARKDDLWPLFLLWR